MLTTWMIYGPVQLDLSGLNAVYDHLFHASASNSGRSNNDRLSLFETKQMISTRYMLPVTRLFAFNMNRGYILVTMVRGGFFEIESTFAEWVAVLKHCEI